MCGDVRNACKILVRKIARKNDFGNLSVGGRAILKCTLGK